MIGLARENIVSDAREEGADKGDEIYTIQWFVGVTDTIL